MEYIRVSFIATVVGHCSRCCYVRYKRGHEKEILFADDVVLMAERMAELQEEHFGWKSALESNGLKVNQMKTKEMVSKIGQVTVRPSSKNDPCGICGRKTMFDTVLCKSCRNCIDGRCAMIKRITKWYPK